MLGMSVKNPIPASLIYAMELAITFKSLSTLY